MPGSNTPYNPPGDDEDADDMSVDTVEEEAEGGLDVDIVDDTPADDRGRKPLAKPVEDPTDEELAEYGARSKKRISELTHARHDERRRADSASRERDEALTLAQRLKAENERLRGVVTTGTKVVIESSVKLAETAVETAKRKLREATDAFDNEAIVTAQDELFEARIKLDRVKNTPAPPLQETPVVVKSQNPQNQAAPVDEKSLRWQQKNQWFGADGYEDVTSYALGLDVKLRKEGVDPRSDDYFKKVDASLKETFPKMFPSGGEGSAQGRAAPRSSIVAASSRSVGTRKVTLTQSQVALAKRMGLTPQQYAAEVVKLEKQS